MKLVDLGLKTKPATKYNEALYISFKTIDKELYYRITFFQSKKLQMRSQWLSVHDKQHYETILKMKGNEAPRLQVIDYSKKQVLEA